MEAAQEGLADSVWFLSFDLCEVEDVCAVVGYTSTSMGARGVLVQPRRPDRPVVAALALQRNAGRGSFNDNRACRLISGPGEQTVNGPSGTLEA